MPSFPRSLSAIISGGSALTVLLATGGSAQAAAKAPAYPNLSVDAASALLPTAAMLPVHMKESAKVQIAGLATAVPCLASLFTSSSTSGFPGLQLKGGSQVSAAYSSTHVSLTSPNPVLWSISATVFHNQAKAKAAMAAIVKAEKACPKAVPGNAADGTPAITRTLSLPYASGAWSGYRSIDHIAGDPSQGDPIEGGRLNNVYLTRGNVLLQIQEVAPSAKNSGARQDTWRKAVVKLVVARFDARR
ncbi:MAG: hypothetical protein QOJ11_141 [Frankiales bacterium]|nr:hypothetical protein [Frankiales bacterium]